MKIFIICINNSTHDISQSSILKILKRQKSIFIKVLLLKNLWKMNKEFSFMKKKNDAPN